MKKVVMLILVIFLLSSCSYRRSPPETYKCPGCNVVFISIDTLRADHLGCYGYEGNTSPFIDSLAAKSIIAKEQISQAPLTSPSHMSMFTSLYPSQHLICQNALPQCNDARGLSGEVITLPMVLKAHGYVTLGYHGGGNIAGRLGFSRGFDIYKRNKYNLSKDLGQIQKWLEQYKHNKTFLFYHTYVVHDPYFPPKRYQKRFGNYIAWLDNASREKWKTGWKRLNSTESAYKSYRPFFFGELRNNQTLLKFAVSQYDAEIAYVDDFIKGLLSALEHQDLLNRTIVIITADHGEEFFEHGGFLHSRLFRETLHVPLIIFDPRFHHYEITFPTTSLDIAPTLLDILDIKERMFEAQEQGSSLMPFVIRGRARNSEVFSEWPYDRISLIKDGWKIYVDENGTGLFYIKKDKKELHNLAKNDTKQLELMLKSLKEKYADILKHQFTVNKSTEADIRGTLRKLGYLN